MKPASIKKFDLLYLGSIVIGLVSVAFNFGALLEISEAEMAAAGVEGMGAGVIIGSVAVGTLISLALWFLVSVLRIELVKYILILFAAWSVLSLVQGLAAGFEMSMLAGIVTTIMTIVAIWFLFQPDAKAWFAEKRGGADPE